MSAELETMMFVGRERPWHSNVKCSRNVLGQIVLQRRIPFEMKLSKTEPLAYGSITKEQFDKEIEKGMSDVKAGKVYSADSIEAEMKRGLENRET